MFWDLERLRKDQHQPAQSVTLAAAQRSLPQHVEKSKMTGRAQGRAVANDQLDFHFQEQL